MSSESPAKGTSALQYKCTRALVSFGHWPSPQEQSLASDFPMKRRSIPIIFIVSVIIFFPPACANKLPNDGAQKNCSYSIEIETTCAPSAETTDHVSVRFGDPLGNLILVKHLKNPTLVYAPKDGLKKQGGAYKGFERCAVDMFEASGPCMTQRVCSLYLKKVGSDDWRPGWVKVLHRQDGGHVVPVSYMFYFRTYVPENVWYGFDYCHSRGGFQLHIAEDFGED